MNRLLYLLGVLTVLGAVYLGSFAAASSAGSKLSPALPAQTWRGHQHVMGFLSVTEAGELRFARFVCEDCGEPDHPGYWIEAWKVEEIRSVMPSALRPFRFGEALTVDAVKYLRVLPANPRGGLGDRTAKTETTE
jgi:hypothetical protein